MREWIDLDTEVDSVKKACRNLLGDRAGVAAYVYSRAEAYMGADHRSVVVALMETALECVGGCLECGGKCQGHRDGPLDDASLYGLQPAAGACPKCGANRWLYPTAKGERTRVCEACDHEEPWPQEVADAALDEVEVARTVSGKGVERTEEGSFDRCRTCGHYRGEHNAKGCFCEIVRATGSEDCPCGGFVEPAPVSPPRGDEVEARRESRLDSLEEWLRARAWGQYADDISALRSRLSGGEPLRSSNASHTVQRSDLPGVPQGERECTCRICAGIPDGEFWTDQCCTKVAPPSHEDGLEALVGKMREWAGNCSGYSADHIKNGADEEAQYHRGASEAFTRCADELRTLTGERP